MEHEINIFSPRRILGIDPGTAESAYSVFSPGLKSAPFCKKADNETILKDLPGLASICDFMVMEQLKAYGSASDSLLFTAMWTGRFIAEWLASSPFKENYTLLPRKTVVSVLCGFSRAGDKEVRASLIDYFTAMGGRRGNGRIPIIGTKKKPGALYRHAGDMWPALAVAVCWHQFTRRDKEANLTRL